jgi:hypothetical protein
MLVADSNEYFAYAERCLEIARTMNSRAARIILREMAAEWTKVAKLGIKEQHEQPAE